MLKIAICDDNPISLAQYTEQLEKIAEENAIEVNISRYASGKELLFEWEDEERQSDALYLDIHMSVLDGVSMAEQLRQRGCNSEIIFLTKDKEKMLDAFDVEAFHYIVKNQTTDEKFNQIFRRLSDKIHRKKGEYITFSCAGENRNILIDSILYFRVDIRVITVYYGRGESFEFYSTIGKVENSLCGKGFFRIYRSILVNSAYIRSATTTEVLMVDGTKMPVGRSYWKELKEGIAR